MAAGSLQCHALRLRPGDEICSSLQRFVVENELKAAFILTCVGSVTRATLRLADAEAGKANKIIELSDRHEIVSLVGTLNDGAHLHASLSDKEGKVVGGHVMGNMIVFTTAEIVIGECSGLAFKRAMDASTGFLELEIESRDTRS